MRIPIIATAILLCALAANSQVPVTTGIQILRAEDSRRYDAVLEDLLRSPNAAVRERAVLAAGRIGDDRAVPALAAMLESNLKVPHVLAMVMFALGEIESAKGASPVLDVIKAESGFPGRNPDLLSRAAEAAGKIAAANPHDPMSKELGEALVHVLNDELAKGQVKGVVRLALTALLRAKPEGGPSIAAKFLSSADADVRADALNTLARLRAKEKLDVIRSLVARDPDPVVRANAARALGAAADTAATEALVNAAVNDNDLRVRVAAIRSLGQIKESKVAERLVGRGEELLAAAKRSRYKRPVESLEMIEIASTLDHLLSGTGNARAVKFLDQLAVFDNGRTAEISLARLHIAPSGDFDNSKNQDIETWYELATDAELLGAVADLNPPVYKDSPEIRKLKEDAPGLLYGLLSVTGDGQFTQDKKSLIAVPSVLTAYAKFKTTALDEVLRTFLENKDVYVRATAAGLIADRPRTQENIDALTSAFSRAMATDKHDDDAMQSILEALYKLDKKASVPSLRAALDSPDYLTRKQALRLLDAPELSGLPGVSAAIDDARKNHLDQVLPYSAGSGSKLGQVLNTGADYRRALSRTNRSTRAVVSTEKGKFTIEFTPEDAPLTVDNFVKLARAGFFNGLEVHRVVPNFVMQDGDPRGDGNGGPGWSIRCEVNMLPYDRGAVGMALSGKDTGGSQWFVTHSPQPHLDGGYTVFGHVAERDMKVVDSIVRGDRILRVQIIGR